MEEKNKNEIRKNFLVIAIGTLILIIVQAVKPFICSNITKIYKYVCIAMLVIVTILISLKQIRYNNKLYKATGIVSDFFSTFVIACVIIQIIFSFCFFKADVSGTSMYSTLQDKDILIVRSTNKKVDNFDIVVLCYDEDINVKVDERVSDLSNMDLLVKRVIAKPGDSFYYNGTNLYLNGELCKEDYAYLQGSTEGFLKSLNELRNFEGITYENGVYHILDGYYFVMGDNRFGSLDSRRLGLFKEEQIIGVCKYRANSLFDWEELK